MTISMEDPLVAGMAIERVLPLHDSCRRLRKLCPESPRVYGVAVMADVSRRRWWPLGWALTDGRLDAMFAAAAADVESPVIAAQQLAATLAHTVIGRVAALVVLEGRAWDAGLENLWVHVDSEGAIDWLGVVDPTVRALPGDPCSGHGIAEGIVELPGEAALATWIAHRCHRSLAPLFTRLDQVSNGALGVATMWHTVGSTVVLAATQMPILTGCSETVAMRRGQAILDALSGFGLPVRRTGATLLNSRVGVATLGQPCLSSRSR